MPRQLHWRQLTLGIIAVAVIAVVTIATVVFGRVGALHGKKVTLYVVTDDATGVQPGTEVWLAGQKQGTVKEVSFRPASSDTLERLLIRTEFLQSALPNVRRSSWASIRPGGSLIGAAVVYITVGSTKSPPLHEGDTVRTRFSSHVGDLLTDFKAVRPAISDVIASAKGLNTMTTSPSGTIGNVRAHGFPQMPEVSARMSRLAGKASEGRGTIGLASRNNLAARASHAMAAADSIRTLVSSNKGTLGRFRRDTTLTTKAKDVLAELDKVSALAAGGAGALEATHPDSALTKELSHTRLLLAELIRDLKKHPLRYIAF
jgi:ABC-type transporter Mla subunit MlaD